MAADGSAADAGSALAAGGPPAGDSVAPTTTAAAVPANATATGPVAPVKAAPVPVGGVGYASRTGRTHFTPHVLTGPSAWCALASFASRDSSVPSADETCWKTRTRLLGVKTRGFVVL